MLPSIFVFWQGFQKLENRFNMFSFFRICNLAHILRVCMHLLPYVMFWQGLQKDLLMNMILGFQLMPLSSN
jgi:hypothetical protein